MSENTAENQMVRDFLISLQAQPQVFYEAAKDLLVNIQESVRQEVLSLVAEMKHTVADQGDYKLAYAYDNLEYKQGVMRFNYKSFGASGSGFDPFVVSLRDRALQAGDHKTAFEFHSDLFRLHYNHDNEKWQHPEYGDMFFHGVDEPENMDDESEDSYSDGAEHSIQWLSNARDVALKQDDFENARLYTYIQYDLDDLENESCGENVEWFETISLQAEEKGDRANAVAAQDEFIFYKNVVTNFENPKHAEHDAYLAADARLKALKSESVQDTVTRLKTRFTPNG